MFDVRIYVDGASKEYTLMIATEQRLKKTNLTKNKFYIIYYYKYFILFQCFLLLT